jgi:heptosyltransferase III
MSMDPQKLLLVRNDNIGDLICSIPAIQLIREHFPKAEIDLLVNSYNAPVVEPLVPKWVDRVIIYRKTKHVGLNVGQLGHLIKFYWKLRYGNYDAAVLLVGGSSRQAQSFAEWSGAKHIIGYGPNNEGPKFEDGKHELEYSWALACHLCDVKQTPPDHIEYPIRANGSRTAIQITSRKLGNRWEVDQFVELGRKVKEVIKERPLLFWSPGDSKNPTHPGDDDKAAEILGKAPEIFEPCPTAILSDLILNLKDCRTFITPDGGAMHLAAAMGIQIVAMFGQSEPNRWRPWTPHARVLQSPSKTIQDISVDDVLSALKSLSG